MYQTITKSDFRNAFHYMGRDNQFSYEALDLLFDYLDYADYELDVIAICCDFNEADIDEINDNFGQEFQDLDEAEAWLAQQTLVVGNTGDAVIYSEF
jgi:hypothetical protein